MPSGDDVKMDAKSESLLSRVHPELAARFRQMVATLATQKIVLRVTSGHRSTERQEQLYAQRASNPNPVAPPGTSKHEKGLAVDAVPIGSNSTAVWQRIGAAARAAGLKWGGDFKRPDKVHFELSDMQPAEQHEQALPRNDSFIYRPPHQSDSQNPPSALLLGVGALCLLWLATR